MEDKRFERALARAAEESTIVWLVASSATRERLRQVVDTWAGSARRAMPDDRRAQLLGPVPTRDDAFLVGFVEGSTPVIEPLTKQLVADLRGAGVQGQVSLAPDVWRLHRVSHGVTLFSASVRWRADAYERQQQRLRDTRGDTGLSRVDVDPHAWSQVIAQAQGSLAELGSRRSGMSTGRVFRSMLERLRRSPPRRCRRIACSGGSWRPRGPKPVCGRWWWRTLRECCSPRPTTRGLPRLPSGRPAPAICS
jgi:hypothetical protein